ncbi:hypothetical protein [Tateyamaria pelophila]|uniref:hypothetical protein n=1 Tax=Tateyamaria pelophila TaxID=328415 RepID=UPI001CBD48D7|nr:hypothetical protein [Tateyamaria pelophila]
MGVWAAVVVASGGWHDRSFVSFWRFDYSVVALARDCYTGALCDQGNILVHIDSTREYQFSGQTMRVGSG